MKKMAFGQVQEDFNFEMEEGFWRHYEFESDRISVESIQLKEMDADQVLRKLKKKLKRGKKVTREDLIPLLLTPLMSGKTSVCQRIVQGFRLLKSAQDCLEKEEVKKMHAILYAFACKFLTREEVKRVQEETDMTILGQMLVEDGIAQGMAQGMERGQNLFAQLISRLLTDGRTEDIRQAAEDEAARKRLYKEYGMETAYQSSVE